MHFRCARAASHALLPTLNCARASGHLPLCGSCSNHGFPSRQLGLCNNVVHIRLLCCSNFCGRGLLHHLVAHLRQKQVLIFPLTRHKYHTVLSRVFRVFPFAAAVARSLSASLSRSRCQTPQTNTAAASQGRLHAWAASCSYPSKERVCTSGPARVTTGQHASTTCNPKHQTSNLELQTPYSQPLGRAPIIKTQIPSLKLKTSNSEPPTPCLESQTPKPNVQTQTPRPFPFPLLAITTALRGRLQVRRQRYDHAGGQLLEQDVHLAARIELRCFIPEFQRRFSSFAAAAWPGSRLRALAACAQPPAAARAYMCKMLQKQNEGTRRRTSEPLRPCSKESNPSHKCGMPHRTCRQPRSCRARGKRPR
jgi:hypothetical protein